MFRHHPDGLIYVETLVLSLAFWQQQEPAYALPAGALWREYLPDVRHTLSDGSRQWAGELPWAEGDRYLATKEQYAAAWDAAKTPPPPAPVLDWDAFRTQMMSDPAYQKMAIAVMATAQGDWLMTTLQDAITMPAPSIALFQPLWNQIIQLTPLKPVAADVTRWQGYADGSNVGIKFLASGAIE